MLLAARPPSRLRLHRGHLPGPHDAQGVGWLTCGSALRRGSGPRPPLHPVRDGETDGYQAQAPLPETASRRPCEARPPADPLDRADHHRRLVVAVAALAVGHGSGARPSMRCGASGADATAPDVLRARLRLTECSGCLHDPVRDAGSPHGRPGAQPTGTGGPQAGRRRIRVAVRFRRLGGDHRQQGGGRVAQDTHRLLLAPEDHVAGTYPAAGRIVRGAEADSANLWTCGDGTALR